MMHFGSLEGAGLTLAAISGQSDGDCGWNTDAGPGNRKRFAEACGVDPEALVGARQIHGTRVTCVTSGARGRGAATRDTALPDTDALVTGAPGVALTILVADCVPVYLYDPAARAIGLVHAGRQGTLQNVVSRAVGAMIRAFGCRPRDMYAVIGPSAGPDRYEVTDRMAEAWVAAGLVAQGRILNLWKSNALQLVDCGLPEDRIAVAGICTISDDRFFSHRADESGCRNMAIAML